ncbi:hypothetical protein FJR71_01955 [Streptococcus xiaochunlingii]|uniref:Uncharacterized protein n=1 Tax=Streptococcus xiaochunlingii TaxID=2589788 RepID=A0ABY2YDM3_9STRE|nr:hypothetical protein FJR71_01955 [Streptococcus xiaochunlingii]
MIWRATRKRLKIRNLTRNPDFSVRLSIFRAFRSCSNQNTCSTFLCVFFRKLSARVQVRTQTLAFRIHHRGPASKVGFIPAPTSLVPYMLS